MTKLESIRRELVALKRSIDVDGDNPQNYVIQRGDLDPIWDRLVALMDSPAEPGLESMNNEKLDKLIEYAETAMADGYPYEVVDEDLALTVKALRALKASPAEPTEVHLHGNVVVGLPRERCSLCKTEGPPAKPSGYQCMCGAFVSPGEAHECKPENRPGES